MRRRALPSLVLAMVALAAAGTRAPALAADPAVPSRAADVTPRVVGPAELEALRIYDLHLDRQRFQLPGGRKRNESEEMPFNESEEYRSQLWESFVSPAPVTDGPAAAQTLFGYVPRLKSSFAVRESLSWVPADCTVAAGAYHLVTAFNSIVAFYTKDGTRTFVSSLDGLLGSNAGWKVHFDPKVVYDESSGRFYLMALSYHLGARQAAWSVAVSITGDPHQGWYVYEFRNELDGEGIDYEELGFGPRAIYLSGNYISFSEWGNLPPATVNHGNALWVLDKTAMLAGQTVTAWVFNDVVGETNQVVQTPKVALVHTPPFGGTVDGFMTAFQAMTNPPNTLRISVWGVALPGNFPSGAPTISRQTVDTDLPPGPPNAQQSGGPARLRADNLGLAPMNLQFRGNTLTLATGAGSGSVSRARVIQLSVVWPSVSLAWQNDFTDGINYHLWPQVAVNARGQAMLGYCRSGTGEFAQFRWTTRTPDDPGFLSSKQLHVGEAYVGNPTTDTADSLYRWGDYSGVAVDPISQGFWLFGMYGSDRGNDDNTDFRMWAGYVPRSVYVDGGYFGSEFGTTQRPWNTFVEAINDAYNDNDVVLKAGSYTSPSLLTKPMTVFADGGTVTLQP